MPQAVARSSKLATVGGRLVSAKSKTGNPLCSSAMSAWVRSRHGGPAAGPDVFAMLGKCRAMARQNKQASLKQAAGKLAEGRGTWQRSERAGQLAAQRKARPPVVPTPPPRPPATPGPRKEVTGDVGAQFGKAVEASSKPRPGPAPAPPLPKDYVKPANWDALPEPVRRAVAIGMAHGIKVEPNGREAMHGRFKLSATGAVAAYSPSDRTIYMDQHATHWAKHEANSAMHHASGWWSNDHADGVIHHEIGHALHHLEMGGVYPKEIRAKLPAAFARAVTAHVSKYGSKNAAEFVAETYSGLKAGKKYPAALMAKYAALKGPKV